MPDIAEAPQSVRTLRDVHGGPLHVGAPDISGPLVVYPILGPAPRLVYTSFSRAHAAGQVRIGELASGASVNDLTVENLGTQLASCQPHSVQPA